jgi:hypothetical protein
MKTLSFKKEALARKYSTMKKMLPVVIVAAVVILCTASTVSAWVYMSVTPDRHVTCPQTSNYWAPSSSPSSSPLLDDKTVTYVVNVETDCPDVSVVVSPEETPISWFSWLTQTLPSPNTIGIWDLDLSVPITLGEDAAGVYTFTIIATDSCGGSAQATLVLEVQDQDYVSETLVQMDPENTAAFTLDERLRSMPVATSVDKDIEFSGTVDYFEKNEYLLLDALACPNFQQETMTFGFSGGSMKGDERFKSCAPLGGTGVQLHEHYNVSWMDQRVESLANYITGEQRYKTELSTYNEFNGTFMLDAKQIVPVSRYVKEQQTFEGNLTVGRHLIFRLPPQSSEPILLLP